MLDFDTDPLIEPAILITIVTEAVLQESVLNLFQRLKVRGYAISPAQGRCYPRLNQKLIDSAPVASEESEGVAAVESGIATQIEIRAIASKEVANVIFYVLKEQQRDFAILAYRQQVEALSEI
jgi:hypothetical protein